MLEKFLNEYLGIEERVNETGIKEKINLNKNQDLAFIRSQFKRKLVKSNPKTIRLINNRLEGTTISLECSCNKPLDVRVLEDRNKILSLISGWIAEENRLGNTPMKLELI